ncbi:MAG: hypothetical protein KA076_03995 [Candidatus Marinimicrobia bacterium]|nr:hypothetical protein [Candidatus Neomarinimicrobiota bacterium]
MVSNLFVCRGYDYSRLGAYFITIVTHNRQYLFVNIVDGEMMWNEFRELAQNEWLKTGIIRPNIVIDAFVIMPNHLHGIIIITDNDNGHSRDSRDSRRDTLQRVSTTITITITITDTNTITDTDTITDTEMGTETDTGTIEQFGKPTKYSIPTIARLFKSTTTRQYIINNPKQWQEDNLNKFL